MSFRTPRETRKKAKSKKRRVFRKSVYDQQREEETIREATDRGYLQQVTAEFLNENVDLKETDLPTVGYLNVTKLHLSSVGALKMCVSLRICLLPGNYITSFDELIHCVNLSVLDLSGNQIKAVPTSMFWVTLQKLRIVYLHDNGISTLSTIHSLSSSSSLLSLTLYDTPLSLKKNYRHHLVNGIWSLKVLDGYVVSDEEIIEDLSMSREFSAMNDMLKIDLIYNLTKESTLEEAVKYFKGLITKVNKTQAKFCPVLIIQKFIRGYLVRKKFKHIMATRVWAATTIQQFYRYNKGTPQPKYDTLQPPSTPLSMNTVAFSGSGSSENTSPDYNIGDNMLKSRKGSTPKNQPNTHLSTLPDTQPDMQPGPHTRKKMAFDGFADSNDSNKLVERFRVGSPTTQEGGVVKVKRRVTVDLSKLESATWETLTSSGSADNVQDHANKTSTRKMKSATKKSEKGRSIKGEKTFGRKGEKSEKTFDKMGIEGEKRKQDSSMDVPVKREHRMKPKTIGKYQTVRVFLGSVEVLPVDVEKDETGCILYGVVPPQQKHEPVVEMLLTKQEMGKAIRKTREDGQKLLLAAKKEKALPIVIKSGDRMTPVPGKSGDRMTLVSTSGDRMTNDQKLFMRTHGTMGLACLRAVHQAYRDREQAQEQANRAEHVAEMKAKRDEIINKLQMMRMDYQENVLTDRIQDGVRIAETLQENEIKKAEQFKKVAARRLDAVARERTHKEELKFIKDFASQQMSVSKALRCHDHAEIRKHRLEKVTGVVRKERETNLKQQALVKRYMEHRQLLQQAQVIQAKAELDMWMAKQAKQHVLKAEERVNKRKTSIGRVREFTTIAPFNAPGTDNPLAILYPGKSLSRNASTLRDSQSCFSEGVTESTFDDSSSHLTL